MRNRRVGSRAVEPGITSDRDDLGFLATARWSTLFVQMPRV
jgi:hypothetical protein